MSYAEHALDMIVRVEEQYDNKQPAVGVLLDLAKAYALLAIAQEISKVPGNHG